VRAVRLKGQGPRENSEGFTDRRVRAREKPPLFLMGLRPSADKKSVKLADGGWSNTLTGAQARPLALFSEALQLLQDPAMRM